MRIKSIKAFRLLTNEVNQQLHFYTRFWKCMKTWTLISVYFDRLFVFVTTRWRSNIVCILTPKFDPDQSSPKFRTNIAGLENDCSWSFQIGDFGLSRNLAESNYYTSHGGKIPVRWTAVEVKHVPETVINHHALAYPLKGWHDQQPLLLCVR